MEFLVVLCNIVVWLELDIFRPVKAAKFPVALLDIVGWLREAVLCGVRLVGVTFFDAVLCSVRLVGVVVFDEDVLIGPHEISDTQEKEIRIVATRFFMVIKIEASTRRCIVSDHTLYRVAKRSRLNKKSIER